MVWTKPRHTRRAVDDAGRTLIGLNASHSSMAYAIGVIENWRRSHNYPLNTFQMTLRAKAKQINARSLIAQRMKRLSSIESKLRRFEWLTLSAMQDIAGCRAIVGSVANVGRLVAIYKESDLKHRLDDEDDYIANPKRSGYRGHHLIYRYHSDKVDTYEALKVEMQIRSALQHAWATAVETVDTFQLSALKTGQGERDWRRFFALMGGAIALRERTAPVPGTPQDKATLVAELRDLVARLNVEVRLTNYGNALTMTGQLPKKKTDRYYLLQLQENTIAVVGYPASELEAASNRLLALEKQIAGRPGADVVLVSVESMASLRRAYPNYFLDTRVFLEVVRAAVA
jgi:RelA/SpoT family protein